MGVCATDSISDGSQCSSLKLKWLNPNNAEILSRPTRGNRWKRWTLDRVYGLLRGYQYRVGVVDAERGEVIRGRHAKCLGRRHGSGD